MSEFWATKLECFATNQQIFSTVLGIMPSQNWVGFHCFIAGIGLVILVQNVYLPLCFPHDKAGKLLNTVFHTVP